MRVTGSKSVVVAVAAAAVVVVFNFFLRMFEHVYDLAQLDLQILWDREPFRPAD
jgi:hypothetical protein